MTLWSKSKTCGVLIVIGAASFVLPAPPAAAQGGIVCEFGSTRYRQCCSESYRRKPNLGARARADDIDSCMKRSARERDTDRDTGREADRRPPTEGVLRRIECGTRGCPDGCADDEIAVSAFCKVGEFPTANGDRDVQCATSSGVERPTVLICGKR